MTDVKIAEITSADLDRYASVPIRFRVDSVLNPELLDHGLAGIRLQEKTVAEPYVKDYDALETEPLTRWPAHFDVSNWVFLLATAGEHPIGAAAVAYRSPEVHMLEGRDDLAVLWDIRVHPDWRRQGIGRKLFSYAADWARARRCTQLKVETQNVNVNACRFYVSQGCRLGSLNRHGYSGDDRVAHETMLLWYLDL